MACQRDCWCADSHCRPKTETSTVALTSRRCEDGGSSFLQLWTMADVWQCRRSDRTKIDRVVGKFCQFAK